MTRQDDRALGVSNELGSALHVDHRGVLGRAVAHQVQLLRVLELHLLDLCVLTNIDQDRTWPPAASDVKRFSHRFGDILRPRDQVIVLCNREGNAGNIHFLKCIPSDQVRMHLPGDADDR